MKLSSTSDTSLKFLFIGVLPMRDDKGSAEFRRAWDKNAENIDHLRLHPDVRDLSIMVGDEEDVLDREFGPGLPNMRHWAREHFRFSGYTYHFDPAALADKTALRHGLGYRDDERVIWVARARKQIPVSDPAKDVVLAMPDAALNRLSQLNLALFLTALNRHLAPEEKVLGLSGVTGSKRLDTLVIAKPARDYSWLRHHKSAMAVTQHLARLLEIALHFAREGREGSSIGAIFVLVVLFFPRGLLGMRRQRRSE